MSRKAAQTQTPFSWSLPSSLNIVPDELQLRLDFYGSSVLLHCIEKGAISTRMVSAHDVAMALLNDIPLHSGLLPPNTLWWSQSAAADIALWVKPQIWPVAVMLKPSEPPQRFRLPMPGLIFICRPSQAPRVYAVKRRPTSPQDIVYHAPLFNVHADGYTCAGSHRYPAEITEISKSFFTSFFSIDGAMQGRSTSHTDSLFALWQELDGKKKYPLNDLVPYCKVQDLMNKGR
jgi:PRTRC genetic system protein B